MSSLVGSRTKGNALRQATLDFFLSGEQERAGEAYVSEVFQILQRCDNPLGLSARCIASLPAMSRWSTSRSAEVASARAMGVADEFKISSCLNALEASGLCYRTYDDGHFLATSDSIILSQEQVQLLSGAVQDVPSVNNDDSPGVASAGPAEGTCGRPRGTLLITMPSSRRSGSWHHGLRDMECGGRAPTWLSNSVWSKGLQYVRKARVIRPGGETGAGRARGVWAAEYSNTGEYLLAGSGPGCVSVIRCADADFRLSNSWAESSHVQAPMPVRHVQDPRAADLVHWNPWNRNEVGSSCRVSGDIHIYNFRTRGRDGDPRIPSMVLSHKQGQGFGGILDFSFFDQNVIVAGTQTGAIALWDQRSSKVPKSILRQSLGGVCYVQMLSDGNTLLGGTTSGAVQIWDIRRAVRSMSVMKMGGKDAVLLSSIKVEQQIPLLNAEGQVCEGKSMSIPELGAARSFAVEPRRQVQVAMTIGSKCVCVFDLVHCRVSHVYCVRDEPATQPLQVAQDQQEQQQLQNVQLQPNRPIWIDSAGDCQTLALGRGTGGADESAITILKVDKPSLVSGGSVIVMQRQRIDTPAKVSCIAAHPSDPSLALGLKDGSLWTLQLGKGDQE